MKPFPIVSLALATALVTPPSFADDAGDEAASTELFNAGRESMRRGEYAAACPKFAESARLKPSVGALAKLAECEEHERRLVSAYTRWKQALNLARNLGDARAADVERQLARLDSQVPKLRVVAGADLPPDAVIRVDDLTLSTAGLGVALPVELGQHIVAASAPHAKPWSTTVDVHDPGATVSVTLPPLEAIRPSSDQPGTSAPAGERASLARPVTGSLFSASPATGGRSGGWRTAGIAAAGTGLAAAVAGGVLGGYALRQRDDAHCAGTVCPDDPSAGMLRSAKSAADVSTALLIGGGALFATGVVVWAVARPGSGTPQVGVLPLPGGGMIAAGWEVP
jgi:hypothetical protein